MSRMNYRNRNAKIVERRMISVGPSRKIHQSGEYWKSQGEPKDKVGDEKILTRKEDDQRQPVNKIYESKKPSKCQSESFEDRELSTRDNNQYKKRTLHTNFVECFEEMSINESADNFTSGSSDVRSHEMTATNSHRRPDPLSVWTENSHFEGEYVKLHGTVVNCYGEPTLIDQSKSLIKHKDESSTNHLPAEKKLSWVEVDSIPPPPTTTTTLSHGIYGETEEKYVCDDGSSGQLHNTSSESLNNDQINHVSPEPSFNDTFFNADMHNTDNKNSEFDIGSKTKWPELGGTSLQQQQQQQQQQQRQHVKRGRSCRWGRVKHLGQCQSVMSEEQFPELVSTSMENDNNSLNNNNNNNNNKNNTSKENNDMIGPAPVHPLGRGQRLNQQSREAFVEGCGRQPQQRVPLSVNRATYTFPTDDMLLGTTVIAPMVVQDNLFQVSTRVNVTKIE